ncbi:MAG: GNAT family N-acetyltransferase [Chitinophagaceae bacterium]|nr:GNAT family N-acetyltransferase [Chitinophagaceae bacterium]
MEIQIRKATVADAELIADLSRTTFYDAFAKDNTKENMDDFMNNVFTKDALMQEVLNNEGIFILAFDGEEAVGYARMREQNKEQILEGENAVEIARIYSTQAAIGKGVGPALMKACIDIALDMKRSVIWLGVWEKNQRAIAFYQKWGFEKFGEHIFPIGTDPQTDWLMKKALP